MTAKMYTIKYYVSLYRLVSYLGSEAWIQSIILPNKAAWHADNMCLLFRTWMGRHEDKSKHDQIYYWVWIYSGKGDYGMICTALETWIPYSGKRVNWIE